MPKPKQERSNVIAKDNMGAGNIFYVKPYIVVARQTGGYVVVLHIVLANQDFDIAVMEEIGFAAG